MKLELTFNFKKPQVTYYSKRYRSLIDVQEKNFVSCSNCQRFTIDDVNTECPGCENEDARRISGKMDSNENRKTREENTTLLETGGGVSLSFYVQHPNIEEGADSFMEKSEYELLGWQKILSKHNAITFL